MKILILNCGSSSIKYQLIDTEVDASALARGSVERIGMKGAILNHTRIDGDKVKMAGEIVDHQSAIEYILAILLSKNHGVLQDRDEIDAVGHRVVHGGEKFNCSVLITSEVMEGLQECIDLAPLHNPHNIKGIVACNRLLNDVPMVGVFDTAFHAQIPDYAYLYGLPFVLYKRYGVRRYGFHGTSHFYVSNRASEILGRDLSEMKVITLHLGNGSSMAAIKNGVSVDTSMGFTPLEGMLMGTRSGDIDAGAVLHIMGREELSMGEVNTLLNKHSGLMGISGHSSDMRDIEEEMNNGNDRARMAFEIFTYRIRKYIGSYAAAMGGLDALVFTGGIGENSPLVRAAALKDLEFLGAMIDPEKNYEKASGERFVSTDDSRVKTLVIPTNEELVIALETKNIVEKLEN